MGFFLVQGIGVIAMGMSSVASIGKKYLLTLKNQRTNGPNYGALLLQIGFPIGLGLVCFYTGLSIPNPGNAISGISIVSALLCSVATMLFQIRASINSGINSGEEHFVTSKDAGLIDQLFAAVIWTTLFGFAAVLVMVIMEWCSVFQTAGLIHRISSAILAATVTHFVFAIGTVLKRLSRIYELVAMQKR